MKKLLIYPLSISIGLAVFIMLVGLAGLQNIVSLFKQFSIPYLIAFLAVSFTINMLSALKWNILLKEQGHDISIFKLYTYKNSAFSISYIMPFARLMGEPVRAMMLKKHTNTTDAATAVFIDKSLEIIMDSIMAAIVIVLILANTTMPQPIENTLLLMLAAIICFIIVFYALSHTKGLFSTVIGIIPLKFLSGIKKWLAEMQNTTKIFIRKKSLMAQLMGITVIQWLLIALEIKFATMIVGYKASLITIMMIMIATGLATVAPIPAGLGVLEAALFSVFAVTGGGTYTGIALSLVIRLKDSIWALLGFLMLSHFGLHHISEKKTK